MSNVLQSFIQKNKVFVFSGTYCPYCDIAKSTLTKLGVNYGYVNIDIDPIFTSDVLKKLNTICGFETIPKIFVGEYCIGGNDDMQELLKTGELKQIFDDEGISYDQSKF